MELRFCAFGAFAYACFMLLSLLSWVTYVTATQLVGPLAVIIIVGVGVTVFGLVAKGKHGFSDSGVMAIIGLVLGVFGLLEFGAANEEYQFTQGVCAYSMIVRSDSGAWWACPNVQASYLLLWISGVGLIIPLLLFLAVPSFQYLQRRPSGQAVP